MPPCRPPSSASARAWSEAGVWLSFDAAERLTSSGVTPPTAPNRRHASCCALAVAAGPPHGAKRSGAPPGDRLPVAAAGGAARWNGGRGGASDGARDDLRLRPDDHGAGRREVVPRG